MQILCRDLTKRYGEHIVLHRLNWQIEAGEQWQIHGISGCGKTTLLRLILGLEKPDGGVLSHAPGLRFSPVFQENRLLFERNAVENCTIFTGKSEEQARFVLKELLHEEDALRKPVGQLSGGMCRRVALARALLAESDVLCLDEPFAGLDPETRQSAWKAICRWRAGRTLLLVSHEFTPSEVQTFPLYSAHMKGIM